MTLRIGSLFTGYGGLDTAAREVLGGGELTWHCDIKPASVALLAHRFPDVPNLGDVTAVDFRRVAPIDAFVAGWPCQPHSPAGKRLGEADPRALWPEVLRAIAEARPAIFLGENVARVTSNGELRRAVRTLAQLGYVGAWRCVRASDIGVCHRRDRCFVVAVAADAARVGWSEGWAGNERQLGRPDAAVGRDGLRLLPTPRAGDDVRGLTDAGRNTRSNSGGDSLPEALGKLLPTPTANHGDGRGSPTPELARRRLAQGRRMLEDAVAAHLLPTPAVADARNTRNATAGRTPENDRHHAGWTLSDVAYAERWGVYAEAIARHERIFDRAAPDPTMISARTGKPQLAPPFVEWMMCLPEGWVTDVPGLARNAMLSLLGDGVVPPQAAHAFSGLLAHLTPERAA